jgi:5-methylcytosine-specific restriction endonuclease McrA
MGRLSIETIKQKVFLNSLETCEYLSGYENVNSIITVKCLKHNHIFETKYENVRRDNRKHHICPICQEEDKNSDKVRCMCDYCGKEFLRTPSKLEKSKSGLHFCSRECKDNAQKMGSGKDFNDMRPNHYGTATKNYREKAFKEYNHECAVCGYNEDKDILEVHHIDENRENNEIDNLIILCPICHRKLTSHKYILHDKQIIKI